MGFEHVHPWRFEFLQKKSGASEIPDPGATLTLQIRLNTHSHDFSDTHGKMDLEKLLWTLSISAQLPETFDLLWANPFENNKIDLNPKGRHNPRFSDATAGAAACDRQTLKSRTSPLSMHPGMKYFRKGNPRCW